MVFNNQLINSAQAMVPSSPNQGGNMVSIPRSLALAGGLCALFSATTALAQSSAQANGLGLSWPNATDISASPHYHVYVFNKDGIRYFQVNDLNGNVRAAVAVANGVVLTLPIGLDAAQVTHSAKAQIGNAAEAVYSDKAVTLTATPSQNGHDAINVATVNSPSICTDGFDCTSGSSTGKIQSDICTDGFDCTSGSATGKAQSICTDGFDCTSGSATGKSQSICTDGFDCTSGSATGKVQSICTDGFDCTSGSSTGSARPTSTGASGESICTDGFDCTSGSIAKPVGKPAAARGGSH